MHSKVSLRQLKKMKKVLGKVLCVLIVMNEILVFETIAINVESY
jgi:hypothetical protein